MKKNYNFYLTMFLSTFFISAFTFGGGYVIVPLMKRKFVDDLHWIEEEEMLNLIAIAQAAPGAVAINGAISIGYRLAGLLGVMITICGTVLPPFIIISILSVAYQSVKGNLIIQLILQGMQAGVVAVVFDVVITMITPFIKDKRVDSIIILMISIILTAVFHINIGIVLLISGIIGIVLVKRKSKI
ncbi:chromate transporter [Anaeromicropila herbilytica]|uniref:Chromate transporter n=1 Tax=Anaeromicropila herbilytica TaxID=2785025 RepID=A0A7R7ELU8_9FIRM|nr:chromate transporter [Anaeromicropila herbilytica]BCN31286.1 chromate transporter [Anaeromicropila herbilytica]